LKFLGAKMNFVLPAAGLSSGLIRGTSVAFPPEARRFKRFIDSAAQRICGSRRDFSGISQLFPALAVKTEVTNGFWLGKRSRRVGRRSNVGAV
jgi:hypothetical protein